MIKIGFVSAISSDGLVSVSYQDEDDATTDFMPLLEGNPLATKPKPQVLSIGGGDRHPAANFLRTDERS